MDFRTCPACQASVLEDDATECPFCGASMTTGKPVGTAQPSGKAAAPAKSAAASPAAPAAKPAAGKSQPPARKPAAKSSASADPFEVDTSAARKATPVRPKPAKGYMIRITCPMCERPGFISEQEVGKEVKCCNPDCLVPVFVANPPREKEPEPEPEPQGSGRLLMYGLLAVVVVAGLGVVFVLNSRKAPDSAPPLIDTNQLGQRTGDTTSDESASKPPAPVAPQPLTPAEILQKSLAEIRSAAENAEGSRDRALGARLLAESLAKTGEPAKARMELTLLPQTSKYFGIPPLVIEAWQQLDAGKQAEAQATVNEAFALKDGLPKTGREALDAAGSLAAVLVAVGRTDDAQTLVLAHDDPDLGRLSMLWRAAIESGQFRFDQLNRRSSLQFVSRPQWTAVALTLAGHGRGDAAREWALAAPDVVSRDTCCAALAADLASRLGSGAELTKQLEALLAKLDPAGRARVWCAAGQGLLERGDQAGARDAAAKAATELDSVPVAEAVAAPEMKSLYEFADRPDRGLPDPLPLRSAALAAADLSVLNAQLGQQPESIQRLALALKLLSGSAPSARDTARLMNDVEKSTAATRRKLAEQLGIAETAAFAPFSRYRNLCLFWDQRAKERRDLEAQLLSRAALAGEVEEVWKLVTAAEQASDGAAAQAYYDTSLPALLIELCQADQKTELKQTIINAVKDHPAAVNASDSMLVHLRRPPTAQEQRPLLDRLTRYYAGKPADHNRVDAEVLAVIVSLLPKAPLEAQSFATQVPDTLLREDAVWLLTARGALEGHARALIDGFNHRSFSRPTVLSYFRGFIDGAAAISAK